MQNILKNIFTDTVIINTVIIMIIFRSHSVERSYFQYGMAQELNQRQVDDFSRAFELDKVSARLKAEARLRGSTGSWSAGNSPRNVRRGVNGPRVPVSGEMEDKGGEMVLRVTDSEQINITM